MNPETPQQADVPAAAEPTPVTSAPSSAPTPAPKDNKKLITIAAIIAGVVLIAVIAIFSYIGVTSVSKQDYADAAKQYNAVREASTDLTRSVTGLSRVTSGTDSEFNESTKEVEDAIAALKTENEALGKLKASTVGEGKELYSEFDTKLDAYIAYGNEILTSVKNVRPALVTCDAVGDATGDDARVSALKACSTALGDVKDIPSAEFKTFIEKMKTEYTTFATTYESITKLTSPFGSQSAEYRALRDKITSAQTNIRTASREFSTAMDKRDDELSVKDAAEALRTYLNEQQRN